MPSSIVFPASGSASDMRTLGLAGNHMHGKFSRPAASGMGSGFTVPDACMIAGCTGSADCADIVYNQAAAATLFPAFRVPPKMRIYVTELWAQLLGVTAWSNTSGANPGIVVTDTSTLALPVAYIPQSALAPGVKIYFPESAATLPFYVGSGQTITATYSAAAKTLTLSGAALVTTLLGNTYVTVVDDATTPSAIGQSMMIASQASTTVITLSAAFPIAPSTAAVYAIQYYQATSGSATTAVVPLAANLAAHQAQGYSLVMAQGTGAGQYSIVSDNTTTTMTIASRGTAPASGTLFQLTSNPGNMGASEFGINNVSMQLSLGAGLQCSVVGVEAGGSNVRIGFKGFLSA